MREASSTSFEKGNKLAEKLMHIYQQNTDYFLSLNPEFRANYDEDLNEAFGFFNSMKQIADQQNQKVISEKAGAFLNAHAGSMR